jgi:Ca-activated chloride channel homolog
MKRKRLPRNNQTILFAMIAGVLASVVTTLVFLNASAPLPEVPQHVLVSDEDSTGAACAWSSYDIAQYRQPMQDSDGQAGAGNVFSNVIDSLQAGGGSTAETQSLTAQQPLPTQAAIGQAPPARDAVNSAEARTFAPAETSADDGADTAEFDMEAESTAGDELAVIEPAPNSPADDRAPQQPQFAPANENPITDASVDNLSTFALDVDTASYTVARNYLLNNGQLPPPNAIRVEEFVNFFPTDYTPPTDEAFALHLDAMPVPFGTDASVMMRVGLQGQIIDADERKPSFLVFVVDTSGSMSGANRIGMVQESLRLLTEQLRPDDCVGIVTYSNGANVLLPPTPADQQDVIIEQVNQLYASGSTYAEEGLRVGYEMALGAMQPNTNTRVILLSDGVANVGATGPDAILETIRGGVDDGVTLTSIGVGMGGYNDVLLERLANDGNGNYYYIDTPNEARRVFVDNLTGTLQVIAYDAKIQVEFNAEQVASYRLLGYENRAIADQDFRNDTVDAGEVGAGHTVTALYEVTLHEGARGEMARAFVRYEHAETREVIEVNEALRVNEIAASAAPDLRLLTAVAEFAELLRDSQHATSTYSELLSVLETLDAELGAAIDIDELLRMVQAAASLDS